MCNIHKILNCRESSARRLTAWPGRQNVNHRQFFFVRDERDVHAPRETLEQCKVPAQQRLRYRVDFHPFSEHDPYAQLQCVWESHFDIVNTGWPCLGFGRSAWGAVDALN
jgi:hypothetical protein